MAKAYGYARVSTSQQVDDGLSLDVQESAVRKYHEDVLAGTSPPVEWGGMFVDRLAPGNKKRGCSGRTPIADRPAGAELCKTLRPGDHVVMLDLSRGFRNFADAIVTIEGWMERKITFHATRRQIDTGTPGGRMIFRVLAMVAEMEREMACERTREAMAWRKARGLKRVGVAPYGKKYVGPKGRRRLVDDPVEMANIATIVKLRDEAGLAFSRIYWVLVENRVLARKGRTWSVMRIWRVYTDHHEGLKASSVPSS